MEERGGGPVWGAMGGFASSTLAHKPGWLAVCVCCGCVVCVVCVVAALM